MGLWADRPLAAGCGDNVELKSLTPDPMPLNLVSLTTGMRFISLKTLLVAVCVSVTSAWIHRKLP